MKRKAEAQANGKAHNGVRNKKARTGKHFCLLLHRPSLSLYLGTD